MTALRGVTRARDQSSRQSGQVLQAKIFGPKQNEKYSALVEDFNKKQAAEYHSQ